MLASNTMPVKNDAAKSPSAFLKHRSTILPSAAEKDPGKEAWRDLLQGASQKSAVLPKATLIVLGERDVGKSSLIRGLQTAANAGRASSAKTELYDDTTDGVFALSYAFLNVRAIDEQDRSLAEVVNKADIWIIQKPTHKELLEQTVPVERLRHAVILICLDLSEPWTMKGQLVKWLEFVTELMEGYIKNMPAEDLEAMRDKLMRQVEKARDTIPDAPSRDSADTPLRLNLGIPIVVVACKADSYQELDTREYPGRGEAILAHMRHYCLPYGAAIVYTCTRDPTGSRNIEMLYRYILHRVYNYAFDASPDVTHGNAYFIPAGWDSADAIRTYAAKTVGEGLQTPLEVLLPPPAPVASDGRKPSAEDEAEFVPMEAFLESLTAQDPSLIIKERIAKPREVAAATGDVLSTRRSTRSAEGAAGSPESGQLASSRRQVDVASPGSAPKGDTDSLRAFYRSLLKKPTASAGGGQSSARGEDSGSLSSVKQGGSLGTFPTDGSK